MMMRMGNGESMNGTKVFDVETEGQAIFIERKCIYWSITIKPGGYAELRDSGKRVEIEGYDKESDRWKCKFGVRDGVGQDVYIDFDNFEAE